MNDAPTPSGRPVKLAYLVSHPIHYQAPLLRRLAAQPDIDLTVLFEQDFSLRPSLDADFGRAVEWDTPLLDGYRSQILPMHGRPWGDGEAPGFLRPWSKGLGRTLKAGGFDALWIHGYHRACHWQAMIQAKMQGMKVLVRDEVTDISARRSGLKRWIKRGVFSALNAATDAWLAIGTLNREFYLNHGIDAAKIHLVPYCVDNGFFQAQAAAAAPLRDVLRAQLGLKSDRPVVLFSAKLIQRKRPLDLLEAFAKLKDDPAARGATLLFAGDGPQRGMLEAKIQAEGLGETAKILGFQSQAQLGALYELADLFVLPSEREAWGLVVNEAMNASCAVICSDRIGSAPDLVRTGENGFIYPIDDVNALAISLRSALRDPARLTQMGARSREIIDGWSYDQDVAGARAALTAIGLLGRSA